MKWFLYIAKCKDNSLYTGITTNIRRRIDEHNTDTKKRAKSLRGKLPVKLAYWEEFENQIDARKRESAIKNWKREYKIKLINSSKLSEFTL